MNFNSFMADLFKTIDSRDADKFVAFLTDNSQFRFGNMEPVEGKDIIRQVVANFFESIKGINHNVEKIYSSDGDLICHGTATYTRHNGSKMTVPFANIFKMDGDLIKDYLIFIDNSSLYQ